PGDREGPGTGRRQPPGTQWVRAARVWRAVSAAESRRAPLLLHALRAGYAAWAGSSGEQAGPPGGDGGAYPRESGVDGPLRAEDRTLAERQIYAERRGPREVRGCQHGDQPQPGARRQPQRHREDERRDYADQQR